MLLSFKNINAVVFRQIGKWALPSYQSCCLISDERTPSHDQPFDRKIIPPDNEERKKVDEPNDSLVFTIANKVTFNVDTLAFLHQLSNFKWTTIKKLREDHLELKKVADQRFIFERLKILGSDLAAAHFIVHRGGAVKFKDESNWIRKDKDDKYTLPSKFVPNLYLEAIDASGMDLLYEGFENLEHLYYLTSLNLSNCNQIDDWCLDRLHIFKESLEHLDLSGCSNVTERGLSCLYRLRNLKTLNLANMPNVSHLQLVCLLLEDVLPQCQILGVNYSDVDIKEDNLTKEKQCVKEMQQFPS